MNRIALAVKSALGLAMLVPPALTFAAPAADSALEELVVTGIRKSLEESLDSKRAAIQLTESMGTPLELASRTESEPAPSLKGT